MKKKQVRMPRRKYLSKVSFNSDSILDLDDTYNDESDNSVTCLSNHIEKYVSKA
jgi:hypothetical protein